jgi:flagellar basal body-associated protein FliL
MSEANKSRLLSASLLLTVLIVLLLALGAVLLFMLNRPPALEPSTLPAPPRNPSPVMAPLTAMFIVARENA